MSNDLIEILTGIWDSALHIYLIFAISFLYSKIKKLEELREGSEK